MKKYANRKRAEVDDYKVGDLVMLSTKNLKYQIVGRRTEKLTERFVSPYKIKKIVSLNIVELELPNTVKIHPVVNVRATGAEYSLGDFSVKLYYKICYNLPPGDSSEN